MEHSSELDSFSYFRIARNLCNLDMIFHLRVSAGVGFLTEYVKPVVKTILKFYVCVCIYKVKDDRHQFRSYFIIL